MPVQAWAATAPQPAASPSASSTQAGRGSDGTVWYLAEGYTGGDFDTYVLVQNPGTQAAKVTLDFQLPPGLQAPSYKVDVPAGTRKTVHLDELPGLGATDVSTRVVSNRPVVAERAMYFSYNGKVGGHDSIGVKYPAATWYLAEGYTGGDFDTYVLVQNPGSATTGVTLDFQLPPGKSAPSYKFDLPAHTRKTVHLDELPGLDATDVSTKVTSPLPVVAERAMYFNYNGIDGGHDSVGVENPSNTWYLAEGYTAGNFETYVLVQNPGGDAARVTLDFQLPPGSKAPSYSFDLPGGTRKTILLDGLPGLAATDVSTKVSANKAVVAERAMYFDYDGKKDGHDSAGATRPDPDWYLAEGYTAENFDTYVLVQNPGKTDKKVTLHFQLPPGKSAPSYKFNLPAGTRKTVHLDQLPGLESTDVSTWVDATGPVVAERAMYFIYKGRKGGSCSLGALYEPPVIPDTTKVLVENDMKHLVGIKDQGKEKVLTFDAETTMLHKVGVGDVIVSSATSQRIPPFKVTKVAHNGGNLVLTVKGASLEDLIWRGRISVANSQAVKSAAGGGDRNADALLTYTHTWNVNKQVPSTGQNYVDLVGVATVTINMDISINVDYTPPSVDFQWKSKYGISYLVVHAHPPSIALKSMSFGASFSENIALDATIHGDFSINKYATTVPGTKIPFPTIEFAIPCVPPIPIWFDPYVQLAVGVDGSVHTQLSAGVTQDATISAGCSYNQSAGWQTSQSNSFNYRVRAPSPPSSFLKYDCTFSLGPQLGMLVYSLAGPYINLLPGYRITGDSNTSHPGYPLLGIYVTLDIDVGVKVNVEVGVLKWSWSVTIFNKYWRVLNWDMLLVKTVWIYSLSPTSGKVGDPVTLNGDGFGSSRKNNSYVSFGSKQVDNSDYTAWDDNSIACKVPADVSGTVHVTVTRIFHDWVVFTIEKTSNEKPFNVTGPPPPGGQELLTNGNFSSGLANWSVIDQGGTHYHGTNSTQVKSEGGVPILFMYRRCPQNDGGSAGVAQGLNALLQGSGLNLTARIRCDYQRGGAIAGSNPAWYPEGAVQFRIKFRRADGSTGEWYHGFYYGSVPGADLSHFTQVAKGSWVDYASGNILPKIGAGSTITGFRIYGFGWDFDGYASNVSLKTN